MALDNATKHETQELMQNRPLPGCPMTQRTLSVHRYLYAINWVLVAAVIIGASSYWMMARDATQQRAALERDWRRYMEHHTRDNDNFTLLLQREVAALEQLSEDVAWMRERQMTIGDTP